MKVLVFSDSHGRKELIDRMLSNEPDCKRVFFLGDGMKEVEWIEDFYPDVKFTCVRGNNDFFSDAPQEAYAHIDGVTIYACHGDSLNVRSTQVYLAKKAKSVMGSLALYGHTHVAKAHVDAETGVTCLNPGALCDGKYCVIEFSGGSFRYEHKKCY